MQKHLWIPYCSRTGTQKPYQIYTDGICSPRHLLSALPHRFFDLHRKSLPKGPRDAFVEWLNVCVNVGSGTIVELCTYMYICRVSPVLFCFLEFRGEVMMHAHVFSIFSPSTACKFWHLSHTYLIFAGSKSRLSNADQIQGRPSMYEHCSSDNSSLHCTTNIYLLRIVVR